MEKLKLWIFEGIGKYILTFVVSGLIAFTSSYTATQKSLGSLEAKVDANAERIAHIETWRENEETRQNEQAVERGKVLERLDNVVLKLENIERKFDQYDKNIKHFYEKYDLKRLAR